MLRLKMQGRDSWWVQWIEHMTFGLWVVSSRLGVEITHIGYRDYLNIKSFLKCSAKKT